MISHSSGIRDMCNIIGLISQDESFHTTNKKIKQLPALTREGPAYGRQVGGGFVRVPSIKKN
jgi:hypothetical protein